MITAPDREMAEAFCRGEDLGDDLVVLCAWCDPLQVQARAFLAQGKRVNHTICAEHAAEQLARARELNAPRAADDFPAGQSGRALVLAGGLDGRCVSDPTTDFSTDSASHSKAGASFGGGPTVNHEH